MAYIYELRLNGTTRGMYTKKEDFLRTVHTHGLFGTPICIRHREPDLEMETRLLPEGSTLETCEQKQHRWRTVFYEPVEIPITELRVHENHRIHSYSKWSPWS